MALAAEGAGIGLFTRLGAGGGPGDRLGLRMGVVGVDGAADAALAVLIGVAGRINAVDPRAAVSGQRAGVAAGAAADILAIGQRKAQGQHVAVTEEVSGHAASGIGGAVDAVHPAGGRGVVKFAQTVVGDGGLWHLDRLAIQLQQLLQLLRDGHPFKGAGTGNARQVEAFIQRAAEGHPIAQIFQRRLYHIGGGLILKNVAVHHRVHHAQTQHGEIQPHCGGADLLAFVTHLVDDLIVLIGGVAVVVPCHDSHVVLRLVAAPSGIQKQVVFQTARAGAGALLHHLAVHGDGHVVLVQGVALPVLGPDGEGQVAIGGLDDLTAEVGADRGGILALGGVILVGHGGPVVDDVIHTADGLAAPLQQQRDIVAAQLQFCQEVVAGGGDPLAVDPHTEIGVIVAVDHHGLEGEQVVLQLLLRDGAVAQVGGDLGSLGLLRVHRLLGIHGAVTAVAGLFVRRFLRLLAGVGLVHGDLLGLGSLLRRGVRLLLSVLLLGLTVPVAVACRAVLSLGLLVVPQADLVDVQAGVGLGLRRLRLLTGRGQRCPAACRQRQRQHQTHRAGQQRLFVFLKQFFHISSILPAVFVSKIRRTSQDAGAFFAEKS